MDYRELEDQHPPAVVERDVERFLLEWLETGLPDPLLPNRRSPDEPTEWRNRYFSKLPNFEIKRPGGDFAILQSPFRARFFLTCIQSGI